MAPVINRGSDHIDWMQQVTAEFMWRCCSAAPRQPVSDLDVDQLIKSCSLLQRKDKPLLLKNSERKGKRNGWKPEEGKVEGHSTDDAAERQRGQRDTSVSNSSPSTCQLLLTTAQTVEIWTDLIWSELIWSHLIWSDLIWSDLIWSDLIKFNSAVFIQTYTKCCWNTCRHNTLNIIQSVFSLLKRFKFSYILDWTSDQCTSCYCADQWSTCNRRWEQLISTVDLFWLWTLKCDNWCLITWKETEYVFREHQCKVELQP